MLDPNVETLAWALDWVPGSLWGVIEHLREFENGWNTWYVLALFWENFEHIRVVLKLVAHRLGDWYCYTYITHHIRSTKGARIHGIEYMICFKDSLEKLSNFEDLCPNLVFVWLSQIWQLAMRYLGPQPDGNKSLHALHPIFHFVLI